MAHSEKNIVITPNIGANDDPKIVFTGADASTNAQNISVYVYPTSNGTLSFEGSSGQLFSITNDLTGTIFSVNDISGIPSLEIDADGLVTLAEFGGNVIIGSANSTSYKFDVIGTANIASNLTVQGIDVINQINSVQTDVTNAYGQANTAGTDAVSAFGQANTALTTGQAAFGKANTADTNAINAFGKANTACTKADTAQTTAVSAFGQANTALTIGQAAFAQANTANDKDILVSSANSRWYAGYSNTTTYSFVLNNTTYATIDGSGYSLLYGNFRFNSGTNLWFADSSYLTWSSTSSPGGTKDVGIARDSAGTIKVTDGSTGNGSIIVDNLTAYGNVGIGTASPGYELDVNGTVNASALLVNGSPISGGGGGAYFSGNNGDTGEATGLGDIFRVHSNTLTQNVTIYSGNNALAAGPVTVASGKAITIQTGARMVIA